MAENDDYGLPEVEFSPIDRGSQGKKKSTQQTRNKMSNSRNERKKDSKAPIVIALVVLLIAVVAALYFFVIKPNMEAAEMERVAQEQRDLLEAEEEARAEEEAAQIRMEEAAAAEAIEEEPIEPEIGAVTVLSAKTGRSYVVIGSFFDEDMANDAGNNMASQGVSTYILRPAGEVKFYRLAIADFDTFSEALAAVEDYKSTYGSEIWALKF